MFFWYQLELLLGMLSIRMHRCRKIILNTKISSHKVNVHLGDHWLDISRVDIYLRDKKWCVNVPTKGKTFISGHLTRNSEIIWFKLKRLWIKISRMNILYGENCFNTWSKHLGAWPLWLLITLGHVYRKIQFWCRCKGKNIQNQMSTREIWYRYLAISPKCRNLVM